MGSFPDMASVEDKVDGAEAVCDECREAGEGWGRGTIVASSYKKLLDTPLESS